MQSVPPVEEVCLGSDLRIGGAALPLFIAGPCVIEARDHCISMAEQIAAIADKFEIGVVFKASFDKANRTSVDSYRGPGLEEGLRILEEAGRASGLALTTDIHDPSQAQAAAEVVNLLQVPAFLCRQTDLLTAAARTGTPVNVKKGQFLAPEDTAHILAKVRSAGGVCLITERGSSFGYRNLVTDFRGIPRIRAFGAPVIFDATHSLQQPGGQGATTGGTPEFCAPLARAAAAVGVDGFFFEVHDDPSHALSDATTQVTPEFFEGILPVLLDIAARVREDEDA